MSSRLPALEAAAVAAVLTLLAAAVVVGDHRFQGPVVLPLTEQHGLHLGDALVGAAWAACLVMLGRLGRFGRLMGVRRDGGRAGAGRASR